MKTLLKGVVLATAVIAVPALAQRTDDNAVKEADDAFGKSVGDEQIGIYNPFQVRGFSPVDAGNVRIEGLYFDQQSNPTERLIGGTTVRVGISAQGYPFPAPTGIADHELRRPGANALLSVGAQYGPWGGKLIEFDGQLPIDGERLGIAGGFGIHRETQPYHGTPEVLSMALLGRYAPRPGIEIIPFWSHIRVRDEEGQPIIFTSGAFLPPRVRRDTFLGQKWADFGANFYNYGLVAKADLFSFDVRLGVFRSTNTAIEDHFDLLFDTDQTGRVGNRVVIISADNRYASTSGELRVARSVRDGSRLHNFIVSLRGRNQRRRYGGEAVVSLGPSQIGVRDFRPEPSPPVIGPKSRDEIEQKTFGLGYRGQWANVGELSIGVQKTDYRKRTTVPDPAIVFPETRAKPWLLSANGAIYLSDRLAVYGGYTRGLEESPPAPSEAINRNQAPPAIRTEQKEGGIRWRLSEGVTAVVGYFDISKPYFNLDPSLRFRQLGNVRNRGIEISIAGQVAPGLTVVAGNVYLDATVSGEEVAAGLIGRRPIGTFRRHTIASVDWQMPGVKPLSLTANLEATSDRTANAANTLEIPARGVIGLGARYRFKLGDAPALLRFNVNNIFNTFGWAVANSGVFLPNGNRRFSLALSADL